MERCATWLRSSTPTRVPALPVRGSTTWTGTVQPSCGEFDTWTGAFLRSSAWGEWPVFRRFANGAGLRGFRYDIERRVDLAIGAALADPPDAARRDRCLRRALFSLPRRSRSRQTGGGRGLGDVVRSVERGRPRGMGSSGGRLANVERRKQRSRRAYWLKHHGSVWYATLVAALAGRYVLYLGAAGRRRSLSGGRRCGR